MFSRACEYGIKATIYIAMQSKEARRVSLKDIAGSSNAPEAFTAKILQILAKANVITSVRGPAGGFEIDADQLSTLKLSQIVSAIDGDEIYKGCGLGLHECSETQPCPVHHKFAKIRNDLRQMLETTTIVELAEGTSKGETYLKREKKL
jgi:Rrf2 family protein